MTHPPAGPSTPPPPPGPKHNDLMTVPQVAAKVGCHRSHVYELIAAGEFPEVVDISLGKRAKTRIPVSSVDAFIARRTRRISKGKAAA